MKNKPTPFLEFAIIGWEENGGVIFMDGRDEAVKDFVEFGPMIVRGIAPGKPLFFGPDKDTARYSLVVSGIYRFTDVLSYIKERQKEQVDGPEDMKILWVWEDREDTPNMSPEKWNLIPGIVRNGLDDEEDEDEDGLTPAS